MAQIIRLFLIFSLLFSLLPHSNVKAVEFPAARVLITELQTESEVSALDDFIELTNRSEDDIDVTGWEIQTKATGATSEWIKRIVLNGIIYAGGSIILSYSDSSHLFLDDIASGHFTTGLSTIGGHVRLFDTNLVAEEDKLGWGSATDAEALPAPKPLKPFSLSRKTIDGVFIDTNNNLADFLLGTPSPRAENIAPEETLPPEEPVEEPSVEAPAVEEPPVETPPDTPPTETVAEEVVLPPLPIRINEIYPDPIAPETDAENEWIELYNPNSVEVNLKDYKLQTGSKFSYSYTFLDTTIAANSYFSISSGESNLVLSNSGGAVQLLDPLGAVVDILVSYPDAETGESYAWDGLTWVWTTTLTPSAENIISQPIIEPKVIKAAVKSVSKSTTVKASATKKATVTTPKPKKEAVVRDVFEDPAAIETDPPLHPSILAGTGVLAILYGGYEYREDFSNRLFRLRRYIQVRRTNRRKTPRR